MASIPPALLHTVQFVGLSTSLLLAGISIGASHVAVPLLHRLDNNRYNPCHHRRGRGSSCSKNRKSKGKGDNQDEAAAAPPSYSHPSPPYDGDSKPAPRAETPLLVDVDAAGGPRDPSAARAPPPALSLSSPAALARLYHRGARASVPLAVLSALASVLVAAAGATAATRHVWAAAAAAALASVPFAVALARATRRLAPRSRRGRGHRHRQGFFFGRRRWRQADGAVALAAEEAAEEEALLAGGGELVVPFASDEEALRTLSYWRVLNMVRTKLVLVSGLLAAWAVVFGA